MNCKFYGRYPFCKQCRFTEEKCIEYQVKEMLEDE